MNAEQRKRLTSLIYEIDEHRAKLEELASQIEEIKDEEEEKYDNLPDSLRDSEKGDAIQEAVDALDNALMSLAEAYDSSLYECIDYLNEIAE